MPLVKDLRNQCFSRLTVLEYAGKDRHSKAKWKCRCECGNTSVVIGSALIRQRVRSCGCLQKDSVKIKKRLDLVGVRQGKLIVKKFHSVRNNKTLWTCLCDCGNLTLVIGSRLKQGYVKSCGCLVKKHGESYTTSYRTQIKRARLAKIKGIPILKRDLISLFAQQSGLCYYCYTNLIDWHIEHVTPLSRGGQHILTNIVLACPSCNYKKGAKSLKEFLGGTPGVVNYI